MGPRSSGVGLGSGHGPQLEVGLRSSGINSIPNITGSIWKSHAISAIRRILLLIIVVIIISSSISSPAENSEPQLRSCAFILLWRQQPSSAPSVVNAGGMINTMKPERQPRVGSINSIDRYMSGSEQHACFCDAHGLIRSETFGEVLSAPCTAHATRLQARLLGDQNYILLARHSSALPILHVRPSLQATGS